MRTYRFHIVNVFAETTFGGNPLAVLDDARGLTDAEMSSLTEQFNLSETTFVLPSTTPDTLARVRIFTPGYEMPFAGHPTLGTAFVLQRLRHLAPRFALGLNVGPIEVTGVGDTFELRSQPATSRAWPHDDARLAALLGLSSAQVLTGTKWMSCGSEYLTIPLVDVEAIDACRPNAEAMLSTRNAQGQVGVHVFARTATGFRVRFFYEHRGLIREDPGTGSACANLGGFLLEAGTRGPFTARVEQGAHTGRLNVLMLRLDEAGHIFVGGRVVPLMQGTLSLE